MNPSCGCGERLVGLFEDRGMEVTVSSVAPVFQTRYVDLGMKCPHGTRWYSEPTREQILRWEREGVA